MTLAMSLLTFDFLIYFFLNREPTINNQFILNMFETNGLTSSINLMLLLET